MRPPRRRAADEPAPTWHPDRQIRASLLAAASAEPGSDEAIEHVARALFELAQTELGTSAVRSLGDLAQPLLGDSPIEDRAHWIAILRWLGATMLLPALDRLLIDLEDIDLGNKPVRLRPETGGRRGGKATAAQLEVMRVIVSAAHAMKRLERTDEVWREAIAKRGTPYSTLKDYRRKLQTGPVAFRWPLSFSLTFGQRSPHEVLEEASKRLALVRREDAGGS